MKDSNKHLMFISTIFRIWTLQKEVQYELTLVEIIM